MQEDSFKNEMTTIKFKGDEYYIPKEKVPEFKKDKGIE
jgi:hypothetical protein